MDFWSTQYCTKAFLQSSESLEICLLFCQLMHSGLQPPWTHSFCGPDSRQFTVFVCVFKDFISLFFRERWKEGEREGEKHQCVVAPHVPPPGDLAGNPGMCTDWESNWQPFGLQACAQSTELHQPGQFFFKLYMLLLLQIATSLYLQLSSLRILAQ